MIRVQTEDFDHSAEYKKLLNTGKSGAVVTFCGLVREYATCTDNAAMELQHYPGMTEKVLHNIETEACKRWALHTVSIIHRVGRLSPGEQIVFVGVSSQHRANAFAACEFIIDILKTQAPFWKKEGDEWVAAKDSDQQAAAQWLKV